MASATQTQYDVIVVGAGNAAFSAAHAAALRGRTVLVLEAAPPEEMGGNSFYTAGATRIVHDGLEDLEDIIESDGRHERTVVPAYTVDDYLGDLATISNGRNDAKLSQTLALESGETLRWLHSLGLKYRLMYERQAYERPDGTYQFWGGLHVGNVDGGVGLIRDHLAVAKRLNTEVLYNNRVTDLLQDGGRVIGVAAQTPSGTQQYEAESVILAAGGFEADAERRAKYLGEPWRHAKVRGTPHNRGELFDAAFAVGADRYGDWGTCHSVQWDAFHPSNESNRELTNQFTRSGYPLGIIVDANGKRFVDEGEDFRNYTYAKFGRDILGRPGSIAYQIYDATQREALREEEYDMPGATVEMADDIGHLAEKVGIDSATLRKTVQTFNASIDPEAPFDPTIKDRKKANVEPPKSNWARPIVASPFYAFPVTCGITFTFGGLHADQQGRVLNSKKEIIPGLFVCGEMLGGLFSGNYPGGSGLASGMVFGRRAGQLA